MRNCVLPLYNGRLNPFIKFSGSVQEIVSGSLPLCWYGVNIVSFATETEEQQQNQPPPLNAILEFFVC